MSAASRQLRALLTRGRVLQVPGVYDGLTARLAAGLSGGAVDVPDMRVRAPHILSLGFRNGMPKDLIERLAAENIHVAPRIGRMRISPHVYNDESDVDRFVETFHRLMPSK